MNSRFGWKKDKRDERDFLFRPKVVKLPQEVSLEGFLPEVRDQGRLGACTGFGIGGNLTGIAKNLKVYEEWFSPLWIYNGGRLYGNTLHWDSGAYPRDCLEFLRDHGSLLEHFRPYKDILDKSDPLSWPNAEKAKDWPVLGYSRIVGDEYSVCQALAEGKLVSLGCPWFSSWMNTDADGSLREEYGNICGGHETLLYGYNLEKKVFYGQNSWGKDWGKDGRFKMPFSAWRKFKEWGGWDAHVIEVYNWGKNGIEPVTEKEIPIFWKILILGALAGGILFLIMRFILK